MVSTAYVLTMNITLRRSTAMKGRDNMPAKGASVGKLTIGPFKLNLVIPKELATMLRVKVIMGTYSEKDEYCVGTP